MNFYPYFPYLFSHLGAIRRGNPHVIDVEILGEYYQNRYKEDSTIPLMLFGITFTHAP